MSITGFCQFLESGGGSNFDVGEGDLLARYNFI